jgi:hypothetical protein
MLRKIMWHLIVIFFFLIKIIENLKPWLVLLSLISFQNPRNQGFFKLWKEIGLAILKKLRELPNISISDPIRQMY